ncbi:MAG: hypothetical protein LBQ24_05810 [Candidatus Peribacteria bacterium]|nr:hypothetical protein [Candidatus Peribacteria bacterium]
MGTYASPELLECFSSEKILVGLDSIDRKTNKKVDIYKKISLFERYCSEFNFVSVEND